MNSREKSNCPLCDAGLPLGTIFQVCDYSEGLDKPRLMFLSEATMLRLRVFARNQSPDEDGQNFAFDKEFGCFRLL